MTEGYRKYKANRNIVYPSKHASNGFQSLKGLEMVWSSQKKLLHRSHPWKKALDVLWNQSRAPKHDEASFSALLLLRPRHALSLRHFSSGSCHKLSDCFFINRNQELFGWS